MTVDYIPPRDADFAVWLANFDTYVTANYAALGLLVSDATAITAVASAFADAYLVSSTPASRTTGTIATTRGLRQTATSIVRPYAMRINANQSVTNEQRAALGITIRTIVPTPIPAPATNPANMLESASPGIHVLQYRDATTPTSKQKPYGVLGLQVWTHIGTTPPAGPEDCMLRQVVTKTPYNVLFAAPDAGKVCTYYTRWQTRSGPSGVAQVGPWSAPLSAVVV